MRRGGRLVAATFALLVAGTALGAQSAQAAEAPERGVLVPADDSSGCSGPSTLIPQRSAALDRLQAPLAWTVSEGAGVVVAVVDSGVDASNPHLSGVLAGGTDLVGDGAGQAGYADGYGHGTAIAGEIAGQQIPGSGVQGLAPQARILSVRVFASTDDQAVSAGAGPNLARLAEGIRFAADAHAQVINVSLSTAVDDPGLRAAVTHAQEQGSLIVASSGNRKDSLSLDKAEQDGARYPAGYPGVLGVAAAGDDGTVTEASIHGPHVAISAPGQDVLTAGLSGGDCVYASEAPATSFAAAYVSAAAALVASAHPDETPAQWAYRLMATAIRAHPDRRDDVSGWGVVQPYEAMVLVPGPQTLGPANPFTRSAPAASTGTGSTVRVSANSDDLARQSALALVVCVVGASILGAITVAGVLVARRRGRLPV